MDSIWASLHILSLPFHSTYLSVCIICLSGT